MGNFFRIPADNRDLNYAQYFSEGEAALSQVQDYHSHNAEQLDIEVMEKLLRALPFIRKEVLGEPLDAFLV
jgi:UDP-glucose 4-epimerase